MKKTLFILFLCFFSFLGLMGCKSTKETLAKYINDLEKYTYTIIDNNQNIYYVNSKQKEKVISELNQFLSVEVEKHKNYSEEDALKHYSVCLTLSKNKYNLFFLYNVNTDGDISINIYDNKTNTLYSVVNNYDAELSLGATINSIRDELKEDVIIQSMLIDVFPWLNAYVFNEIESVTINSGMPPLTPLKHEYFKKDGNKGAYLAYLRNCSMHLEEENISVPGGASKKVIFKLDNTNYELNFYDGFLSYNGKNYSIIGPDAYVAPDEIDYSFNFNVASGELFKAGIKIDNTSLETKDIRFIPKVTTDYLGIPEYELKTTYGSIYIYNNAYININGMDYAITKYDYKIDNMIDNTLGKSLTHIENPHVLSKEVITKLVFEKGKEGPDYESNIISLNNLSHYEGENLASLLGLPSDISDEMIKEKYSILKLKRTGPANKDFENLTLSDLFIETSNLYVTVNYNIKMNIAYDAAICEYVEYVLVNNDFSNKLRNRFNLYCNNKYLDGYFDILPYDMIDDIKEAYHEKLDAPKIDIAYDVYINKAFGEYNKSVAVIMSNSYFYYLPAEAIETVGGYTFVYQTSTPIEIYHENHLYSLTDAFKKGFITQENLQTIYNLHNKE